MGPHFAYVWLAHSAHGGDLTKARQDFLEHHWPTKAEAVESERQIAETLGRLDREGLTRSAIEARLNDGMRVYMARKVRTMQAAEHRRDEGDGKKDRGRRERAIAKLDEAIAALLDYHGVNDVDPQDREAARAAYADMVQPLEDLRADLLPETWSWLHDEGLEPWRPQNDGRPQEHRRVTTALLKQESVTPKDIKRLMDALFGFEFKKDRASLP
jgi:hypothetical protein